VQHASHTHPHVNITVEFSDTRPNFGSAQFRPNGNICIFSDIRPNPQNVIRVRVYTQTNTQTHKVITIPLTSPIHNALRTQREKRIPIVSHHCHLVSDAKHIYRYYPYLRVRCIHRLSPESSGQTAGCVAQWQNVSLRPANFPCPALDM